MACRSLRLKVVSLTNLGTRFLLYWCFGFAHDLNDNIHSSSIVALLDMGLPDLCCFYFILLFSMFGFTRSFCFVRFGFEMVKERERERENT